MKPYIFLANRIICTTFYLMVISQLVFRFTVNKYRRNEFLCFNENTKTRTQSKEQTRITRMHSSRMRTSRALTVFWGGVYLPEGVYLPGGWGVPARGGCTCRGVYLPGGVYLPEGGYLPGGCTCQRGVYLPGGV